MSYHELDPGDEECPKCGDGYMVQTDGDWHQCSECGFEAEENEYGF